jgi:Na+-translocating ferredoxin:NAD+ oxidoreductase RnfC subunit
MGGPMMGLAVADLSTPLTRPRANFALTEEDVTKANAYKTKREVSTVPLYRSVAAN